MGLTKISTDGFKDDAVTTDKLANSINTDIAANTAKVQTTINNNADNKIITGSGTANTLEGEALAQIDSDGDLWIGHAPTTHYDNRKMFLHQPTAGETAYLSITGDQGAGIVFGDSVGQNTGNYESLIWHNNSDDSLKVTTDNGNKGIKIENGGDVEIIDGNVKFASGHGIDFSATSDGSGTDSSELLDDYEEGTWTPTLSTQYGSWTSIAYSEQHGFYIKVGRKVTAWVRIRVSSIDVTGASGYLYLNGLPYTVATTSSPNSASDGGTLSINYYSNLQNLSNKLITGYSWSNTNSFFMMLVGEAGSAEAAHPYTFNAANAQIYGYCTYFTA